MQYFLAITDPKTSTSDFLSQKLEFYQPEKILLLDFLTIFILHLFNNLVASSLTHLLKFTSENKPLRRYSYLLT